MLQGAAGAFAKAGNAVNGRLNHTARCLDNATDRAAAATEHGVKASAWHIKQAAKTTGCWMRDNMKVKSELQKHLPDSQVMSHSMSCLQHIS